MTTDNVITEQADLILIQRKWSLGQVHAKDELYYNYSR